MAWFRREKKPLEAPAPGERTVRTEGLWLKCDGCRNIVWKKDLEANLNVCPRCQHHYRIGSRERLELLFDDGNYTEHDADLASTDPLKFVDTKSYEERLRKAESKTGMKDAIVLGEGALAGRPAQIGAMEFGFIGGSMGAVVGEKVTRAIERSLEQRLPLVIVSCSGGARMMEGVVSLMQMAKISAALARLDEERIPYVSVLTDPTTGGVTACYAMLGDLNIAEPGALPEGFQRSEFLLEKGFLDAIVHRKDLKSYLANAFDFMSG
jgi:acetyl-CoA carboxylase carboxyl transferase subunit beta